jgi:hypothetical protein
MKKTSMFAAAVAVMIISGCSKPVEKMNIELLFTIDGSFEPKTVAEYDKKFTVVSDIEVDKDGNIYVFNPRLERILKFDRNGEFVKYFGSRGTGKGDFMNAIDFTILNDTVYVKNTFTSIIIRNTLDGEYIDYFPYADGKLQMGEAMRAVSDSSMVGYLSSGEVNGEEVTHSNRLVILNKKHEEKAVLREFSAKLDRNDPQFFEFITKYAHGNGKIFVAENEDNSYGISIFDLDGNRVGEIRKDYEKISYNDLELEKIGSMPIAVRKTKDELENLKVRPMYKKSINAIFFDKSGRLIVCPSVERTAKNQNDFVADIFENDKFKKRVVIPQLKGEDFLYRVDTQIFFIGERIYEVLNNEMKINVYGY